MNYSQLSQAIQDYAENTESTFVSQIPTFVKQAEQRVYNSVHLPNLRKNVTGATTSGNKYLATPTDWLADFSLAVVDGDGNYEYLLNKDVNFIRQAFPSPATTGEPTHYAIFDNTSYILGPTPNAAYTVELHYYYYPESIVTAGTSWLGDNFDSVLLYGSLLEAYTFMKGETDVIQGYQKRYDDAMALLKQLGDGKNRQDTYRSGQVRVPVR
jgi:hypothetical protein